MSAANRQPGDERLAGLLADAARLLDQPTVGELLADDADPRESLSALTGAILHAVGRCSDRPTRAALLDLGVRTQDALWALQTRACEQRLTLLEQVQQGLARLGQTRSSTGLIDNVCAEAARSTGLKRVMLSRVVGSTWYPWIAHLDGDPGYEAAFVQHVRGLAVDLTAAQTEQQVLLKRRPQIVNHPKVAHPEHYGPVIAAVDGAPYVVVPITPAGRVIGFLHGDHRPDLTPVDEIDRDVLWAFAEGFGRIYERMELLERLQAQRSTVLKTIGAVERITDALDKADVELARDSDERLVAGTHPGGASRIDSTAVAQLTRREREVLTLVVRGLGSAAIAEQLLIKEGTVNTHVKHILRKLGAANRAELIGRMIDAIGTASSDVPSSSAAQAARHVPVSG